MLKYSIQVKLQKIWGGFPDTSLVESIFVFLFFSVQTDIIDTYYTGGDMMIRHVSRGVLIFLTSILIIFFAGTAFAISAERGVPVKESFQNTGNIINAQHRTVVSSFPVVMEFGSFSIKDKNTGDRLFSFDSMVLDGIEMDILEKEKIPRNLSVSIKGIRTAPGLQHNTVLLGITDKEYVEIIENIENLNMLARELGYEKGVEDLAVDFDLSYGYDEKEQAFDLRKLGMGVQNAGRIEFGIKLSGIKIDDILVLSRNPSFGDFVQWGSKIFIDELRFAYTDESLFDRIVNKQAADSGTTPENIRMKALVNMKNTMGKAAAGHRDISFDFEDFFLGRSKKIELVITPEKSIPLFLLPEYLKDMTKPTQKKQMRK